MFLNIKHYYLPQQFLYFFPTIQNILIFNNLRKKKRRINKLKVVYSDETPRKPINLDGGREKTKNVGSISFVPPVAGMLLASAVIKDICEL